MQPQVLIVGAGPTGLILTLTLLQSGVPVRIIDKAAGYHVLSRGAGVHPRILEIEYFLGTLQDVQSQSSPTTLMYLYDPENPSHVKRTADLLESMEPTPHFPITELIMVNQYLHEGILRSHVEALGGKIELNTELCGLEQDAGGVTVHLKKLVNGKEVRESSRFSYVVGADGGHSTVRKLTGLQFIGETFEQEKLMTGDVDLKGFDVYGWHMFTPDPSLSIIFRSTNIPDRYQLLIWGRKYSEIAEECLNAGVGELQEIITRLTKRTDIKLLKIHAKLDWRYNVRMVDHFQKGRIFVAGDAAHAHSPMGAQGMSSGIQDAFNLAWKLALAVKDQASPALLASYEEERLPAIAEMLYESSKLHRQVYEDKDAAENAEMQNTIDTLRSAAVPITLYKTEDEEAKDEAQNKQFFRGRKLFQLDLNYRWSSIVLDERFAATQSRSEAKKNVYGASSQGIHAGDRAPDAPDLVILRKGTPVGKVDGKPGDVARIFDLFDPTAHIALIFSSGRDESYVKSVLSVLQKVPAGAVMSLLIVPPNYADFEPSGVEEVSLVMNDSEGHAYRGYGVDTDASVVVLVRPDAMIGAFVKSAAGVQVYFSKVFSSA